MIRLKKEKPRLPLATQPEGWNARLQLRLEPDYLVFVFVPPEGQSGRIHEYFVPLEQAEATARFILEGCHAPFR